VLRENIGSKSAISFQRGPVDSKHQAAGVGPYEPFFFSENLVKESFAWYKKLDRSSFFVTMHALDRRTNGRTKFSSIDRVCIPCSAVKIDTGGGDNFTYTGTRPRWTYINQIWHGGLCRRCNHPFQILSKSVEGFPSCEGPKWGSSIDFDSRPYNRSALPRCL